jgi:FkbM family methyltransferase
MIMSDGVRLSPAARTVLAAPLAVRQAWLDYMSKPSREMMVRIETLVTADIQVRVEDFEGEFVIGPRSHLLNRVLQQGCYEPELAALFRRHLRPERDVIDVGANVGFFTVLAGKRLTTGRALAVEASSAAYARLSRNIALNDVGDKVTAVRCFVSDSDAEVTLNVIPGREEYSSAGAIVHDAVAADTARAEIVPALTLARLVGDHGLKPALIKIDVEGAEGQVFAGAEPVLREHRPVVLFECVRAMLESNGSSPEAIFKLFEANDYTVRDAFDDRRRPGSDGAVDVIALPN